MILMRNLLFALVLLSLPAGAGEAGLLTIGDGQFSAGISPASGGVLHFGPPGRNLLHVNPAPAPSGKHGDWISYGGDWLWSSLQSTWPFLSAGELVPPDRNIRWQPVARTERSLTLKSALIRPLGIELRRTFHIDPAAGKLMIENRITRRSAHPQSLHLWSVTQLPRPEYVLLDLAWRPEGVPAVVEISRPNRVLPEHCTRLGNAVRFDYTCAPEHAKIGTLGSWIAAVYPAGTLLQRIDFLPGECYPELSSVQVYSNREFLELELLSPNRHLRPGESLQSRVEWQWLPGKRPGVDGFPLPSRKMNGPEARQ